MGRAPCCDKASVKKGPWSPEEDAKLKGFVEKFGTGGNWIALPQKAGLKRCGKSCRLRWLNYLRPNIRHGEFSDDEDRIICSLYASIGSRWSVIAAQLPGRTDNDIKNYWNTKLKKKLLTMIPSLPFQPSSLPSFDHHTSHQFVNTSSLFYAFTPNFLNLDNTSNSLFVHDDHSNVTNLHSPPPQAHAQPPVNNLMNNNNNCDLNDNFYNHLGLQDDQHNMCNTSPMLMFGSTASSSSESGSCMSQISHGNYHKDHGLKEKYQIKQKDYQITLHDQVLGDQIPSQSFTIKNHVSPMQNDLDDVKQTNYLFHDGQKGTCSYYY